MKDKKLLVEGNDDRHVIWALCEKHRIQETFDVIDCNGIDNLIKQIPVRIKESDVNTIGIIVDADENLNSRWSSIKDLIINAGFDIPVHLPKEGLITENETQKIGVWIMPNNNENGMLEDFITFLVPDDDLLLPVVKTTLDNLESVNLNKYPKKNKSKATIHSWLAWQEEPGIPMGLSITKRYLSTDEQTCCRLINWLNKLFV